jgi:hypothetical protein
MEKLKLLPEQKPLEQTCSEHYSNYKPKLLTLSPKLSGEFRKAIDKSPEYIGLSLDGKTVELSCLSQRGFNPDIGLEHFLRGAVYANLIGKKAALYYPEGAENEIVEKINRIFTNVAQSIEFAPYSGIPLFKIVLIRRPIL